MDAAVNAVRDAVAARVKDGSDPQYVHRVYYSLKDKLELKHAQKLELERALHELEVEVVTLSAEYDGLLGKNEKIKVPRAEKVRPATTKVARKTGGKRSCKVDLGFDDNPFA